MTQFHLGVAYSFNDIEGDQINYFAGKDLP